jgi:trehalose-6-phosphate synthase
VGFHTYDYARHFLTSCTRILGSNTSPTSVEFDYRIVKVGAYPVGVDPEKFEEVIIKWNSYITYLFFKSLNNESTILRINELQAKYKSLKVIVGVERLDYIKGLTQKLLAYEELLEENPELIGKVKNGFRRAFLSKYIF